MPFHAALFDLDGTLLDTLEDLADSMNAALERLGHPTHPLPAFRQFVGDGIHVFAARAHPDESPEPAAKGVRDVYITGRLRRTSIYDRELLEPGNQIEGPAVIEQKDSTTLLPPGSRGRIDGYRNIIIQCRSL